MTMDHLNVGPNSASSFLPQHQAWLHSMGAAAQRILCTPRPRAICAIAGISCQGGGRSFCRFWRQRRKLFEPTETRASDTGSDADCADCGAYLGWRPIGQLGLTLTLHSTGQMA